MLLQTSHCPIYTVGLAGFAVAGPDIVPEFSRLTETVIAKAFGNRDLNSQRRL